MGKRIALILSMAWLVCFLVMAAQWLPRNQLYYFPLNIYGSLTSRLASYEVWPPSPTGYSPVAYHYPITVVPPWSPTSYQQLLQPLDHTTVRTLVVCSGLDGYMVTHYAEAASWGKLKRVVVFDGGHHLATLATGPQVLLVPVSGGGYAAHTYMHDGMPVKEIKAIIQELGVSTQVVTAPRWSVVKCEWGLYGWARRLEPYTLPVTSTAIPAVTGSHYAISNQLGLAYITSNQQAQELLLQFKTKRSAYKKIYLAFDYRQVKWEQAQLIAEYWSKDLSLPVKIVNQDRTAISLNR